MVERNGLENRQGFIPFVGSNPTPSANYGKAMVNEITILNYSNRNSTVYDNPTNKNFVYGQITSDFVNKIKLKKNDSIIADIGCGTGFVFEFLNNKIKKRNCKFIGIDPAKGMINKAKKKYKFDKRFSFYKGSFDKISLEKDSVDRIISTLALHWAPSINRSLKELQRVLKPTGSMDILMIDKNDGKNFKKIIFKTMKKYLTIKQIFNAAKLIQRISSNDIKIQFSKYFDLKKKYKLSIINVKKIIYGSYDQHMSWWEARSGQIISEIKNKSVFMSDLKKEFKKIQNYKGIPFDLSVLYIRLELKKKII